MLDKSTNFISKVPSVANQSFWNGKRVRRPCHMKKGLNSRVSCNQSKIREKFMNTGAKFGAMCLHLNHSSAIAFNVYKTNLEPTSGTTRNCRCVDKEEMFNVAKCSKCKLFVDLNLFLMFPKFRGTVFFLIIPPIKCGIMIWRHFNAWST